MTITYQSYTKGLLTSMTFIKAEGIRIFEDFVYINLS